RRVARAAKIKTNSSNNNRTSRRNRKTNLEAAKILKTNQTRRRQKTSRKKTSKRNRAMVRRRAKINSKRTNLLHRPEKEKTKSQEIDPTTDGFAVANNLRASRNSLKNRRRLGEAKM